MKVTVKKIDALRRELQFEVPKERVSQKLEEVYDDLSKVAKVKGFRPGKVPRHVLEAEHGALAQEEAIKKIIPDVYKEGLEKENIAPIDLPEILDVSFKDGIVTFKAHVDIKPEIKLKNYKGIKVQRKSTKVTDDEINKTLDYFKKSQGEDKDVTIDDEFVKGLGYPDLETFKQSLTRQMEIEKDRQNRLDLENQIVQTLLKDVKVMVPQSLVKKQIEHRIHEATERMKQQGLKEEDIQKKNDELRKNLKDPVERDIKVYLILDKIAEVENMPIKQGENMPNKVMAFLMKEAKWQNES